MDIDLIENSFKEESKKVVVSYTQFYTYMKCPFRWYNLYAKKIIPREPSINAVFGSAIHLTVQEWLNILYNDSVKNSNLFDYEYFLKNKIMEEYSKEVKKFEKHFSTPLELSEFYQDGIQIMKELVRDRNLYFTVNKDWEIVDFEYKINEELKYNVYLWMFLDVVFRDKKTNKYQILDLKTSSRGWGYYDKNDKYKSAQLLLYKHFLSKKLDIKVGNIDTKFFILKRKLIPNDYFTPKRIQIYSPPQALVSVNKYVKEFNDFVNYCYNDLGVLNENNLFPSKGGENYFNCKFCEFKNLDYICPKEKREV